MPRIARVSRSTWCGSFWFRGLVQTRVRLGPWKDRLLADPLQVMSAYLERTQGVA